ncbi:hypothetical protein [Vibrio xiamenensis]|nr:hypothetical protein [Vibrio xiamenensis]
MSNINQVSVRELNKVWLIIAKNVGRYQQNRVLLPFNDEKEDEAQNRCSD